MNSNRSRAFGCPQKYIQGPGELHNLPALAAQYGKKAFILLDSGVYNHLFHKISCIYSDTGLYFYCMRFTGESCRESIDAVKQSVAENSCDVVVGMGGGKCIDTAKFVSSEMNLPRVIVPTAASTDTPAAGLSILYTQSGIHVRSEKLNRPSELVLVDSQIIADAPARLFSAGIGDALATYFEALANEATDTDNYIGKGYRRCRAGMAIARECYDILMEYGIEALRDVKEHRVTEAVENVIEANTLLSGLGFENTGCAAAHGIHSGLSEIESAHAYLHGEKVAFGLICQLIIEEAPRELVDKLIRFLIAADLPVCLGDISIEPTSEVLQRIADHVIDENPLMAHEPVTVSKERLIEVILKADKLGQEYKII